MTLAETKYSRTPTLPDKTWAWTPLEHSLLGSSQTVLYNGQEYCINSSTLSTALHQIPELVLTPTGILQGSADIPQITRARHEQHELKNAYTLLDPENPGYEKLRAQGRTPYLALLRPAKNGIVPRVGIFLRESDGKIAQITPQDAQAIPLDEDVKNSLTFKKLRFGVMLFEANAA